jgi:uncharacterized protein with HEPN domain
VPARDWKTRLQDVIDAVTRIERYTQGMTSNAFRADDRTVDAVVRNLIVLGEASRHIPEDVEQRHPEVPWDRMRGIRNVVVHEYFGVDAEILWETARHDLPPLLPLLENVLRETP